MSQTILIRVGTGGRGASAGPVSISGDSVQFVVTV
jgi:hypothetical protein